MTMRRTKNLLTTFFVLTLSSQANAEESSVAKSPPNTLTAALEASKANFDLRIRYEGVDQDGISNQANALTYRIRAGLETGTFKNTSFLIDVEHIEDVIDDFNSTTNAKSSYPVVADPNTTEINRIQITNTSIPDTKIVLGRQRIIMDDSRFIGNVGWRQNEQTFDALRVTNSSFGNLKLDAAYVTRVNRIFGEESAAGKWTGDSYLFNVSYPTPIGDITGFTYLIDADEAAANSSQTIGVRLSGEKKISEGKISYTASYAQQQDYGSSNLNYSADYYLAEAAYGVDKLLFGAGYEVLGGDDQRAFNTPFATLHKFQGWTDKFLVTPINGIEDLFAKFGYKVGDVGNLKAINILAMYHNFSAETGSSDYGSEINLVASALMGKSKITLKYSDYSAKDFATDTSKLWASIDFAF